MFIPEGKVALPLHPDPPALVGLLHPGQALVGHLQTLSPPLVPYTRCVILITLVGHLQTLSPSLVPYTRCVILHNYSGRTPSGTQPASRTLHKVCHPT